jgi:hypothetical protein
MTAGFSGMEVASLQIQVTALPGQAVTIAGK